MSDDTQKIPVTILTGYLGAGKTTLLNRLLAEKGDQRFVVIENEFGETGIDNDLVIHSEEEIFEMNNGCICCTVRGDMVKIMERLLKERQGEFDRVIIETTGLADPAPVAQTFLLEAHLYNRFHVDGIATIVDAKHLLQHLDDGSPEAARQVAFADRIVLNKIDLVTTDELQAVKNRIRAINPTAQIKETENADVPTSFVLDVNGFDLERATELDPAFEKPRSSGCNHDHSHDHDHHHALHHEHEHGVVSIGIELPGAINVQRFEAWMQVLVMMMAPQLYRYKGVLNVAGSDQRYLFQGIHMLYEGRFDRPWRYTDEPSCRFVFIGKDLKRETLEAGFKACIDDAEQEAEPSNK